MGLPINLPKRLVRGKSAFTAEWGNSIREAIWRLSKQKHPGNLAVGSSGGACPLGRNNVPGYVQGGGSSQLIEPDSITPAANTSVWLVCPWTAVVTDGVLQAGGTMGTVTVASGASVPSDSVPVIGSLTGTAYVALFGWDSEETFVSQGCGTVDVGFCPGGGFVKTRIAV